MVWSEGGEVALVGRERRTCFYRLEQEKETLGGHYPFPLASTTSLAGDR